MFISPEESLKPSPRYGYGCSLKTSRDESISFDRGSMLLNKMLVDSNVGLHVIISIYFRTLTNRL